MKQRTNFRVYRRLAQAKSVDAVVVSSPLIEDQRVPLLASLGLPAIVHGRTRSASPYAHLDIDNEGAFQRATRMLNRSWPSKDRADQWRGALQFRRRSGARMAHALTERGLTPPPQDNAPSPMTDERGYRIRAG